MIGIHFKSAEEALTYLLEQFEGRGRETSNELRMQSSRLKREGMEMAYRNAANLTRECLESLRDDGLLK